jgi:hypothetical protein
MKVLVFSPQDPATASKLRNDLLNEGLKPEDIITDTESRTSNLHFVVNKRGVTKLVFAKETPPGTIDGILKKIPHTSTRPKLFMLHDSDESRNVNLKNGSFTKIPHIARIF